jgi:hypothetical protein
MVDFDAQIIGVRIQQILKDRKIKQKALVALLGLDAKRLRLNMNYLFTNLNEYVMQRLSRY